MRVIVTGAASDFGTAILPLLAGDDQIGQIVALDIRKVRVEDTKIDYVQEDVRSPRLDQLFTDADAVIHLAFVVEEIRDKQRTHDVNIEGSKNVLHACDKAGVKRLIYASSVSAYGVDEDHGEPVDEAVFPSGSPEKYYYYDKAEVEHYVQWWQRNNPDSKLSVALLRPPTVVGPDIDNSMVDLLAGAVGTWPHGTRPFQLIHQSDLAKAFHLALKSDPEGPINLGTSDWIEVEEMAKIHGQRMLRAPIPVFEKAADIGFRLHLLPASSQWVSRGDPVVSHGRASDELGWTPRFSARESAYINLIQHGRPIVDGSAPGVLGRWEVAEAALEPTTRRIKSWVGEVDGLARAVGDESEIDRFCERARHTYLPYKDSSFHLEVHRAEDEAAPTVVFSSGLGAYSRFYLPLLGKLCDQGLNVVAPDRPGHGLSEGRRGDVSWQATLDTLEESVRYAREQFGGPVVLAGSSLGGIITWFALTRQVDVDAAVCHNIAHPEVFHEPAMRVKVPLLKALAKVAPHAPIPITQVADFGAVSEERAILESFEQRADKIMAWTVCARAVAGVFNYVPPIDWSEVKVPVAVLVGGSDRMVTAEFTEEVLAQGRPERLDLKVLPNMGHMIFHDNLDQMLPILTEFIQSSVAGPVSA